jgi:hypothetical protein
VLSRDVHCYPKHKNGAIHIGNGCYGVVGDEVLVVVWTKGGFRERVKDLSEAGIYELFTVFPADLSG